MFRPIRSGPRHITRDRDGRPPVAAFVAGALGTGLVAAAVVTAVVLPGTRTAATSAAVTGSSECPSWSSPLTIMASPEIAPVVSQVVEQTLDVGRARATDGAACPAPVVRPADLTDTLALLTGNTVSRPDVWIPDSSAWIARMTAPKNAAPVQGRSLATSPYVLAVPQRSAVALHPPSTLLRLAELLPPSSGSAPLRWAFPDPAKSVSSAAAVSALLTDLSGSPTAAVSLAALVRTANVDVGTGLEDALARTKTVPTIVPTTEQQAYLHNRDNAASPVAVAYGDRTSFVADYPFVTLTTDRAKRQQASALLSSLTGDTGRRLLAAQGFRDVRGIPAAVLTAQKGFDHAPVTPQKPDAVAVSRATNALATVRRGSRLLAVLDVSGSMALPVPGVQGATRIDLALMALTTGLAVYPDSTVAGLWTFSTNLTRTTDYRTLVRPVPLGIGPDGTSGRARLAQALAGVRVKPNGDTGLYDTVLAAVRTMRATWDPTRVNSVVLVTDGANDDPHGISITTLLRTLTAERDAHRPVTVFAIAYGPSADLASLRQITAATGGAVYAAKDPRAIGTVLQDAVGRRVSAP